MTTPIMTAAVTTTINTPRANVLIPTLSVRLPAAANTNVTATPPFILILPPIVPLPRSFPTNVSMLPARIMPNANAPLITNPVTPPRTLSGSARPVRASAKPSMPPATASRDTNMSVRNSGRPIRMTFVRTASNITKAARPAGITVI